MPMPWTYRHASKEFRAFLDDAKERMNLTSDNMTYTAVDAVFQVFRRRLTAEQGLRFADHLPCVLRAIFLAHWTPSEAPLPFGPREALALEVRQIRPHHNLTPATAIEDVAWALRRHLRQSDMDRLLATFPDGAAAFWQVSVADPSELEQRII
ncbi:DUF2267 domain-containing protein [Tropicimonas sp. IMCC34043]|uniref:DUF2267 domain-containing protein n=1 Tax=Tropicimonas sp. IMCC34043 TaxID=2248760 RepID=UPI000E272265|nr:DUF2267 domain-containing protein [Tropicimonas sp. IMCC34043]